MKVLVLRFEPFPFGTATAFRAFTLCKMMAELNNEVYVVAPEINCDTDNESRIVGYEKIKVFSVKKERKNYEQVIRTILETDNIDLIMRSTSIKHYHSLKKIYTRKNIHVVLDSVEWYDSSNWRLGRCDYRYWLFQFLWRFDFPRADGIIAISRLIEKYYL